MELTVQQPCPTCGAEILLNEDDRLIQCSYCDVHNYMVQRELPRFALPARLPSHVAPENIFFVPYLRFKGTIYSCQGLKVQSKIVDTTRIGFPLQSLPASLGLRPQAMRVQPVTEDLAGHFVRQTIKARTIFTDAVKLTTLFSQQTKEKVIHRAFIGETVSRVYQPVYAYHGSLYDGITHDRVGPSSLIDDMMSQKVLFQAAWEPRFLSTICPGCGDMMHGSRDTLVMGCTNCASCWQEEGGRFSRLDHGVVEAKEEDAVHLPFWQMEVETDGYDLTTLADYLRFINHPVLLSGAMHSKKLTFFIPAFKVNPATYLQAAANFTAVQLSLPEARPLPLARPYPYNTYKYTGLPPGPIRSPCPSQRRCSH